MADINLEAIAESTISNLGVSKYLTDEYLPLEAGTHLYRIDESTLKRAFERHSYGGFIVLSANRGEGSQEDQIRGKYTRTREDNVSDYKKLLSMVRTSPFGYLPVWGGFRENGRDTINPEPSFIVFPDKTGKEGGEGNTFDDLLKFGIEAAKMFNQDSIMVKYPVDYPDPKKADKTRWVSKDGIGTDEFGNTPKWDDPNEEFYTKDRRKGRGGVASMKRWMMGRDPATRVEGGKFPIGKDTPKVPSRFSSPWDHPVDPIDESYAFYLESPSRTYNRFVMRWSDGYDRSIKDIAPWYNGRFGSV